MIEPAIPYMYLSCITHRACVYETKTTRGRKMADVLDVDVEDKGGFSEDEGDGKSINNLNYCNGATVKITII